MLGLLTDTILIILLAITNWGRLLGLLQWLYSVASRWVSIPTLLGVYGVVLVYLLVVVHALGTSKNPPAKRRATRLVPYYNNDGMLLFTRVPFAIAFCQGNSKDGSGRSEQILAQIVRKLGVFFYSSPHVPKPHIPLIRSGFLPSHCAVVPLPHLLCRRQQRCCLSNPHLTSLCRPGMGFQTSSFAPILRGNKWKTLHISPFTGSSISFLVVGARRML